MKATVVEATCTDRLKSVDGRWGSLNTADQTWRKSWEVAHSLPRTEIALSRFSRLPSRSSALHAMLETTLALPSLQETSGAIAYRKRPLVNRPNRGVRNRLLCIEDIAAIRLRRKALHPMDTTLPRIWCEAEAWIIWEIV